MTNVSCGSDGFMGRVGQAAAGNRRVRLPIRGQQQIRARCANSAGTFEDRVNVASRSRSSSRNTSAGAGRFVKHRSSRPSKRQASNHAGTRSGRRGAAHTPWKRIASMIRLVLEAREQEPELSLHAAVRRIGPKVGINLDTLRGWCQQAEVDAGRRPGTTTSGAARIQERENRELKRANEILLAASSFFARELDPRLAW